MSLTEIQRAVDTLQPDERARLAAWMVSRYPILNVDQLMAHAATLIDRGEWTPPPPTDENSPRGEILGHALRVAEQFNLGK
ncbi:MAG: hypothetical protein ACR2HH_05880 [Chthoniobacterales bacterium]